MWGLPSNLAATLQDSLPPITFNGALMIAIGLIIVRLLLQRLLAVYFQIVEMRPTHSPSTLEHAYFYHLSIVVLILAEVNWNMVDLAVWVGSYVGVGMVRRAIYVVRI